MKRLALLCAFVFCLSACANAQVPRPEGDFAKLYEDLKSENPDTRYSALRALDKAKPPASEVVPVLTELLKSDDVSFREAIATRLLEIAGKDHGPALQALEQIEKDNRLIQAIWEGSLDKVNRSLADGASVNGRYLDRNAFLSSGRSNYTPVMAAVLEGRADILKSLLMCKPDLEAKRKSKTALYYAVLKKDQTIVTLLKEAGADGDPKKMALAQEMILAACRGYEMVPGEGFPQYPGAPSDLSEAKPIEQILARGADINLGDPEGHTPLMYAANLGLLDNVKTLIANGAAVNQKGPNSVTALSLAKDAQKRLTDLPADSTPGKGDEDGGNLKRVFRSPAVEAKVKAYSAVIDLLERAGEIDPP